MTFPTEQQVEAVAHVLYVLDLDSWEDIVGATRIALNALAPEWREMERDAERYRCIKEKAPHVVGVFQRVVEAEAELAVARIAEREG